MAGTANKHHHHKYIHSLFTPGTLSLVPSYLRWHAKRNLLENLPMKPFLPILLVLSTAMNPLRAARAPIETVSADPYASALVIDTATGATLFEEHADAILYPASMVKLMVMLLVFEQVDAGRLNLTDMIPVTEEAAHMGGAQVYLANGESFSLDDMLYALCIKSANDAAVALAIHVAGSKDAFVQLMNARAVELGMNATRFATVHGLPPDPGQEPDRSSARDIARLSREILKYREVTRYTSAREKWFRNNTFQMLTHNRILHNVEGCDGLKTGYFRAAGFSVAATAQRSGRRVIAVVMGSTVRQTRDAKAAELIDLGFARLPEIPADPPPPPQPTGAQTMPETLEKSSPPPGKIRKIRGQG